MLISNPLGANRTVADYQTGRATDGDILHAPSITNTYRADAAIARGAFVSFHAATATKPLGVEAMASGDDDRLFAGVAAHAAAAGDSVLVVQFGHALALCAGTPVFGDRIVKPSTAGIGVAADTDPDAAAVIGSHYGTVLGPADGGSSGLTPVFVRAV